MKRVLIEDAVQLALGAGNFLFTESSAKRSLTTLQSVPDLANDTL
jgi:hypothetical protein